MTLQVGLRPLAARLGLLTLLVSGCTSEAPAQSPPTSVIGEIDFNYIDHIFLDVTLNDSLEAVLLYDPVQGVILDERFTRRMEVTTFGGAEVGYGAPVYVGGAGSQRHEVTFARDLTLQLEEAGDAADQAFELTPVIPLDSMMAIAVGRRVDGLFGIDILSDYVLEFDFEEDRFVLHDPVTFAPPDGAIGLSITPMGGDGKPTIPVVVHLESGETVEGQFVLDFGMGGSLRLTTGFVEANELISRVSPTVPGSESGLGGALQSQIGRVPAVTLGSVRVDAPVISMAQETEGADAYPDWDGLIGMGLLDRYRVFYDAPGRQLWLLPTERSNAPFVFARTGLGWEALHNHSSGLVVRSVREGSAAADAGFVVGDRLLSVNDQDATTWTRREWAAAIDRAVTEQQPLEVRVNRNAQMRSLRLTVVAQL